MLPKEFEQRMKGLLGEEYTDFLAAYALPRNAGLRYNPLKTKLRPGSEQFALAPIPWEPWGYYYDPAYRPGRSPLHEAGAYYLQEPSAMAPAGLLQAEPGMQVLDLCAAPGGKTTQLAAAMEGRGLLVCNEIHPKRARILARNIERMGIANALVLNEHPQRLEKRFPNYFDRILVDAPCSGEGMFRKEEAAVADWSPEIVEMCADRQLEILFSAAAMLKPGGRMVYSTCTFAPAENEGVISRFLRARPEFYVEPVHTPWFSPGRPDWIRNPADGLEHTVRLWPHKLRGEGHFAAVLRRSGTSDSLENRDTAGRGRRISVPGERILERFVCEYRLSLPQGYLLAFGQSLYLVPDRMPVLDGLKVLRPGLEVGQLRKDRLEPAHAWALWLKSADSVADYSADSREIAGYLRGETLKSSRSGWTLVTADGLSLGWAKGNGGILKNHYPKALRHLV